MHTIILKLDPTRLVNPDLDIRYRLPDLLIERSGGAMEDLGYDYAEEGDFSSGGRPLLLFLRATDLEAALACVRDVIENVQVLGNDLCHGVVVAVEQPEGDQVVYPPNFHGKFTR